MLARAEGGLVMVVDVQEKLLPHMQAPEDLVGACGKLIAGARLFEVPVVACEQHPRGLGPMVDDLRGLMAPDEIFAKTAFSALADPAIAAWVHAAAPRQVVLCGIEAHVCVLQTALDLRARDLEVFVVADAVSSRTNANHELGLARMRRHGVEIVSLEMVLFEWAGAAGNDRFRAVSALVR